MDDEYQEINDSIVIHDFELDSQQHGAPRTNKIPEMAVMTHSNPDEAQNPDLRRALRKDGWFGWEVQKTMLINKMFKKLTKDFKLNYLFVDDCYYYMRKYKDRLNFSGKNLDDVIPALFYFFVRLNGQPLTLFDFKRKGYNTRKIYNIYTELIKKLNIYKKIRPQEPTAFVEKAVNYIYDFNEFYPDAGNIREKKELISFIKDQFVGIYRKTTSVGFIDISENGLSTVGALLYVALKKHKDYKITQKDISQACGITEVTLRKYIKKLENYYRTLEE